MIDFEKELTKFQPLLDIDQIESMIEQDDIKDLIDILKSLEHKEQNNF